MKDPASFTEAGNWDGGFYELALELARPDGQEEPEGPGRPRSPGADTRLQRALTSLVRAAAVEGCCADARREPEEQSEVPCTVASLAEHGHLRGRAVLPSGHRVVCGILAVREEEGSDWLVLYVPLTALGRTDRRIGGFPFGPRGGPDSLAWRGDLDGWLAGAGRAVHREVPLRLGLIGFEVSGETDADRLRGVVPEERWEGFLLPVADSGLLRYAPANR